MKRKMRIKRLIDIILGLLGIIFSAPLWILIGIVVRLCVNGSILFRQTRVGYKEEKFQILKFRTVHDREGTGDVKARIPICGKVIRRLKLDELPQLINIIRGEMSFVGPRPYIEEESAGLPAERYRMKPGLTGLAQVNGNTKLDWEERTAYDLEYVNNYSLWRDMTIMLLTVRVIIFGEESCVRHLRK